MRNTSVKIPLNHEESRNELHTDSFIRTFTRINTLTELYGMGTTGCGILQKKLLSSVLVDTFVMDFDSGRHRENFIETLTNFVKTFIYSNYVV